MPDRVVLIRPDVRIGGVDIASHPQVHNFQNAVRVQTDVADVGVVDIRVGYGLNSNVTLGTETTAVGVGNSTTIVAGAAAGGGPSAGGDVIVQPGLGAGGGASGVVRLDDQGAALSVLPTTTNLVTIGSDALALAAVRTRSVQADTGQDLDIRRANGAQALWIRDSVANIVSFLPMAFTDNISVTFGGSSDAQLRWSTASANNALYLATTFGSASQSGNIIVTTLANVSNEHGLAAVTTPRLSIFSAADMSVAGNRTQYIQMYHDGTVGVLRSGNGVLLVGDQAATRLQITQVTGGSGTPDFALVQRAHSSGAPEGLVYTAAQHTGLAASTDMVEWNLNFGRNVTVLAGSATYYRVIQITAPTLIGTAPGTTFDNVSTVYIAGAPTAGANMTFGFTAAALRVNAGLTSLGGAMAYTGVITDTIAATQNNYNPTGFSDAYQVRLNLTGNQTITGFLAPTEARSIVVTNIDTVDTLTLANASGSSAAANQILTGTGADITVPPNATATLVYDTGTAKWRVSGISTSGVTATNGAVNRLAVFSTASNINGSANAILNVGSNLLQLTDGATAAFNVQATSASIFLQLYRIAASQFFTVTIDAAATNRTLAIASATTGWFITAGGSSNPPLNLRAVTDISLTTGAGATEGTVFVRPISTVNSALTHFAIVNSTATSPNRLVNSTAAGQYTMSTVTGNINMTDAGAVLSVFHCSIVEDAAITGTSWVIDLNYHVNGGSLIQVFGVRFDGSIFVQGTKICDASGNLSSANGVNYGPAGVTLLTVVGGIVTAVS